MSDLLKLAEEIEALAEITRSQTAARLGIDNSLPDDMLPYWKAGCEGLEVVRTLSDAPVTISSGYRCEALNRREWFQGVCTHRRRAVDLAS